MEPKPSPSDTRHRIGGSCCVQSRLSPVSGERPSRIGPRHCGQSKEELNLFGSNLGSVLGPVFALASVLALKASRLPRLCRRVTSPAFSAPSSRLTRRIKVIPPNRPRKAQPNQNIALGPAFALMHRYPPAIIVLRRPLSRFHT